MADSCCNKKKKKEGENVDSDLWYDNDLDLNNRVLYLGSSVGEEDEELGIDSRVAERFLKSLYYLHKKDPKKRDKTYAQLPRGRCF